MDHQTPRERILEEIEVLKEVRQGLVHEIASGNDSPNLIVQLANIQSVITAFEAVLSEGFE